MRHDISADGWWEPNGMAKRARCVSCLCVFVRAALMSVEQRKYTYRLWLLRHNGWEYMAVPPRSPFALAALQHFQFLPAVVGLHPGLAGRPPVLGDERHDVGGSSSSQGPLNKRRTSHGLCMLRVLTQKRARTHSFQYLCCMDGWCFSVRSVLQITE